MDPEKGTIDPTKIVPTSSVDTDASSSINPTSYNPSSKLRQRVTLNDKKKLSDASMTLAWTHYLNTRPLRNEETDQPLGFIMNDDGTIARDPMTGKPKSSCCGRDASIRSVNIEEFTDLGPGLALTFRFMQVGTWFFIAAFLLSSIGWIVESVGKYSKRRERASRIWKALYIYTMNG